ncbi:Methane oxygenase PmoA [Algoriphagus faecimaris]|uniref:Methane oxygenase PmoA n=1 Tax=Algoriphagus faecimaris TaxID=686796 RepID=A0A1G6VBK3_9BACT|nr:PmoA family protein [Algoriphagus faecimaris]SDD50763.1 Methane oxygenase PmoA [Algoriphagus faecimaris]
MSIKRILFGVYFLVLISTNSYSQDVSLKETPQGFQFLIGDNPVLTYQSTTAEVPQGVNKAFAKSGFIHPLISLAGQVLTSIQPEDHYHHYGIWGPWTRATIEGREVDFWNIGDEKGRVDFSEVLEKEEGNDLARIVVKQIHQDLTATSENKKVALEEILSVTVTAIDSSRYQVDYLSKFWTLVPSGMTLDQYRYGGGIFIRAVSSWGERNSQVLTSEMKSRDEADDTRARWVILRGESSSSSGQSGILFLSHSDNWDHPEPLRVWPSYTYEGLGNVFLGFSPIKEKEWRLTFGEKYQLAYRMIIFDGDMSAEEADQFWNDFVHQRGN